METEVFCEGHEKREEKEFTKPITEYDAPKKQEIREQSHKKNDIDYKKRRGRNGAASSARTAN